MHCRRCGCNRVMKLEKRLKEDNDVYRCAMCGYIFSPLPSPEDLTQPGPAVRQAV